MRLPMRSLRLRCIIGPDIPNNAGSLGVFQVVAPKGCILNAQPPAPVAMRHTLGQMTPDLVYGCLSQAIPDQVPAEGASCMYDLPLRHVPEAAENGNQAVRAGAWSSMAAWAHARGWMGCRPRPFPAACGAVRSRRRKPSRPSCSTGGSYGSIRAARDACAADWANGSR